MLEYTKHFNLKTNFVLQLDDWKPSYPKKDCSWDKPPFYPKDLTPCINREMGYFINNFFVEYRLIKP